MRRSIFCKKVFVSLVLCCTIGTSSQAIDTNKFLKFFADSQKADSKENFFFCNKLLAASKGAHFGGEIFRITSMQSKDAQTIKTAALVSAATAALVLGMKLFAAYKQKWIYDGTDSLLYLYPIMSAGCSIFDLVKSLKIVQNADTIALNNKKNSKKAGRNQNALQILIGLLAAETGGSLYTHYAVHNSQENVKKLSEAGSNALQNPTARNVRKGDKRAGKLLGGLLFGALSKVLSKLFWFIRHGYESKYLNTEQASTSFEDIDGVVEDYDDYEIVDEFDDFEEIFDDDSDDDNLEDW